MSKLVLFLPDGTTLDIPLEKEHTTLGRRSDNDVCLPNPAVSGQHAVVRTILSDSFLEDLKSTNGTLINGERVAKHILRDSDEIDIGRHRLVYCVDDEAIVQGEFAGRRRGEDQGDATASSESSENALFDSTDREAPPNALAANGATMTPAQSLTFAAFHSAEGVPSDIQSGGLHVEGDIDSTTRELPRAALKILTGPRTGEVVALTKEKTMVGRAGIQVAAICREREAFVLMHEEGHERPAVNRETLTDVRRKLSSNDEIRIAGTRAEFVLLNAERT